MIGKIKSYYILKKIFSLVDEEKKLKLVIYNKRFQNKLNLDINNYKILSGKYIIYESKHLLYI